MGSSSGLAPGSAPGGKCAICATQGRCLIGSLPQSAAGIGPLVRERAFRQGEMLSRQGERSFHLRVVKVGTVFLCRDGAQRQARPLAVATRGAVFGLCASLRQPNQVSIVAGSSGRYCEVATERIDSLASNDRGFQDRLAQAYSENYGSLARWAEAAGRRGVVAQVGACLELMAQEQESTTITLPSHTAMAELLGTTRESVARALATLEEAGCLLRKTLRRCDVFPGALRAWLAQ